jgi:formiminotetrahydrofolate cyclodeaminase
MSDPRRAFGDETLRDFVAHLSSAEPIPGGGSAAAVGASLAAALVAMVASLSRDRPAYAPYVASIDRCEAEGRRLAARCLALADEDAAAYGRFAAVMKMPRETDEEKEARETALGEAATVAAQVPLQVVLACREIVAAAEELAGRSNRNAASDLGVSAHFSVAGAHSAAENVRVNLPSVPDRALADDLAFRTEEALADVERIARAVRSVVAAGSLREPVSG